jgi:hypothetical protein
MEASGVPEIPPEQDQESHGSQRKKRLLEIKTLPGT